MAEMSMYLFNINTKNNAEDVQGQVLERGGSVFYEEFLTN